MSWLLGFPTLVPITHVSENLLFYFCHHYTVQFWFHSHMFFSSMWGLILKGDLHGSVLRVWFSSLFRLSYHKPLLSLAIGEGKIPPNFSCCALIGMWYFPRNTIWLFCHLIFSGSSDTFLAPSVFTHTDVTNCASLVAVGGLSLTCILGSVGYLVT